jgi:hypothetical protein
VRRAERERAEGNCMVNGWWLDGLKNTEMDYETMWSKVRGLWRQKGMGERVLYVCILGRVVCL